MRFFLKDGGEDEGEWNDGDASELIDGEGRVAVPGQRVSKGKSVKGLTQKRRC